jgi:hypothetical protein
MLNLQKNYMARLSELEKMQKEILTQQKTEDEIVSTRINAIEVEKKILSLVENVSHCERLEKYIATIGDHFYYNQKTKEYKKIFDIRKDSVTNLFKRMKSSYLLFQDATHPPENSILQNVKTELQELTKILRKPSLSIERDENSGGNKFNYDRSPILKIAKNLNPNFSKSVVILSWSIDDKGAIKSSLQCKRISAEWIEHPTKDRLRNSIFGTTNEWQVTKQKSFLKNRFRKIKIILDNSFDYHSTGDENLIKNFCLAILEDHLMKISNTRKASSRFGL